MPNDQAPEPYFGELEPDRGSKWRWRLVSAYNGDNVACSGQSFASRGNARRALRTLFENMSGMKSLTVLEPKGKKTVWSRIDG